MPHKREDGAATDSSHNLRDADGAIKQAQIGSHVTIALQGIRHERERHRQHGSPTATYQQERNNLQVFVRTERNEQETNTPNNQTDRIG